MFLCFRSAKIRPLFLIKFSRNWGLHVCLLWKHSPLSKSWPSADSGWFSSQSHTNWKLEMWFPWRIAEKLARWAFITADSDAKIGFVFQQCCRGWLQLSWRSKTLRKVMKEARKHQFQLCLEVSCERHLSEKLRNELCHNLSSDLFLFVSLTFKMNDRLLC